MRKMIFIGCCVCVFAYMCLIFYVSSIPGLKVPIRTVRHSDKIAHFFEYFVLGSLLSIVLYWWNRSWKTAASVIAAATVFAVSDEIHQSWVPNRDASIGDIIADVIGASVATITAYKCWPWVEGKWLNTGSRFESAQDAMNQTEHEADGSQVVSVE